MKNLFVICLFFLVLGISPVMADIVVPPVVAPGTDFSISGITNFNTDNKVLIEVFPASFGPAGKFETSMTGGSSQVVPVRKNESGQFFWNGTFTSTGWGEDTYMVRVEIIGKDYRETTVFSLTSSEFPPEEEPGPARTETAGTVQTLKPVQSIPGESAMTNSGIPEDTSKQSPMAPGTLISALLLVIGIIFIAHRR